MNKTYGVQFTAKQLSDTAEALQMATDIIEGRVPVSEDKDANAAQLRRTRREMMRPLMGAANRRR
jgi:hypothetical protein